MISDCGVQQSATGNGKIIGGYPVDDKYKYPWFGQLILKSSNQANCGGTLIAAKYALSAAHCFTS